MRVATYNINGITARLENLLQWLEETRPDVACLQELKTPDERFPTEAIGKAGYRAIWHGQKSWNGVAILSRGPALKERRRVLPGDPKDSHSRYLEVDIGDFIVACLYLPNGNPAPGPKFDYKLMWFARLIMHAETLLGEKRPVILAGDYNVMPTELDVYKPERWLDDALFRPEVREAYRRLLAQGWTDAIRKLHPTERIYTFWKYWRNSFQRDAGLRIDHLLLNAPAAKLLKSAGVDRATRAKVHTSDHAPVWIELGTKAVKKPASRAKAKPKARAKRQTTRAR
jgi:exodeoxyribonuclease-3